MYIWNLEQWTVDTTEIMLEVWWLVDPESNTHIVLDPSNPFDRDILDNSVSIRTEDKSGETTKCFPYFHRLEKRVPCLMKERTWFV